MPEPHFLDSPMSEPGFGAFVHGANGARAFVLSGARLAEEVQRIEDKL